MLTATYWSVLPYAFGPDRSVKYKLEPEVVPDDGSTPDLADPFYLRADLQRRLTAGDSRFRLLVQFQTDEDAMPLDRATVRWDEGASRPVHVATLVRVPVPDESLFTWTSKPRIEPRFVSAASTRIAASTM